MMIKYRVREVAKDLDIPNKDVIDTLAKYFPEPKKYMTALNEEELDVIFEASPSSGTWTAWTPISPSGGSRKLP